MELIRLHALGEVITWVGYRIITLVASGTEPFKLSAGIREDKESKQSHQRLIYNLDRNSDPGLQYDVVNITWSRL